MHNAVNLPKNNTPTGRSRFLFDTFMFWLHFICNSMILYFQFIQSFNGNIYIYPHSHASLCHFADKEAIFVSQILNFYRTAKLKKKTEKRLIN